MFGGSQASNLGIKVGMEMSKVGGRRKGINNMSFRKTIRARWENSEACIVKFNMPPAKYIYHFVVENDRGAHRSVHIQKLISYAPMRGEKMRTEILKYVTSQAEWPHHKFPDVELCLDSLRDDGICSQVIDALADYLTANPFVIKQILDIAVKSNVEERLHGRIPSWAGYNMTELAEQLLQIERQAEWSGWYGPS